MDENIQKRIDEEIIAALEEVHKLKPGSKEYREGMEAIAVLQRLRQEDVRIENEALDKAERREEERLSHGDDLEFREHEQEAKDEERKHAEKHKKIENCIKAAGVILPIMVYTAFGIMGMKFEETGTITSFFNKLNFNQLTKTIK